ncbi:MAG TPA: TIGR02266 family protein, partial [Anaeromyxobacteraceae bacterium]|nr:TIGR02266 family protein [Anaeromyxobacteraceae bacterium]
MEGPPDQKRGGDRTPIGLVVRLAYGSVEEFAQRFAVNLSRGGVFIRTRDPRPAGTVLAFELKLASGETVVKGEGVVRWIQAEDRHAHPPRAPGMGVEFTSLDDASRALVERLVSRREPRGAAPGVTTPAPVAERPLATPPPTRAPAAIPSPPVLTPAALPRRLPTPQQRETPVLQRVARPTPAGTPTANTPPRP